MGVKAIRVRGKWEGEQFRVLLYQDVSDGITSPVTQFDSHNTITNILRLNRQRVSQRGFVYSFPIKFGE